MSYIPWTSLTKDNFLEEVYDKDGFVKSILRSSDPIRKKNMNDITNTVASAVDGVEVKHFALALDKDGKEIRIEISPAGIAQDAEDTEVTPTVH